jgi:hypothetical protein
LDRIIPFSQCIGFPTDWAFRAQLSDKAIAMIATSIVVQQHRMACIQLATTGN